MPLAERMRPRALSDVMGQEQIEQKNQLMSDLLATALSCDLTRVFSDAGSASLQAELVPVRGPVQPGDVLIQGGHPGHAVQVLDVAEGGGKRYLLLGQSFMPAQQLHVLKNLGVPALSPWFDEAELDHLPGLMTPEWLPFARKDVRRFPALPGID